MIQLNATLKGVITGLLMITTSIVIYWQLRSFGNSLQYLVYFLYGAGITWVHYAYTQSAGFENKFGKYFSEGFKCFIVVTLLMVVFTFIFLKTQPALKEQMAIQYKTDATKAGQLTPAEIETALVQMKKYFETWLTSMALFSYLFIGALVTAVSGGIFMTIHKKD
jgi:hypothetical protein